jgi:Zn-dependent protease with chaperone function
VLTVTGVAPQTGATASRRHEKRGTVLQRHNHYNGLKTVMLFGGIWAVLLLVGAAVASYFRSPSMIVVFALVAVGTTAYGYWNSDKLAIRAMRARPVTEAEQPAMYRIVRELSAVAQQPVPRLYVSPTLAPNAFATDATRRTRRSAARSASSSCSTSASCAGSSVTSSCTCTTATSSPARWPLRSPV